MINQYDEQDFLLLSGIQHYVFCDRQWALIHMEQRWAENSKTVEGQHVHTRVDDPFENETRGSKRTIRSIPVVSKYLGLQGVADMVEFVKVDTKSERTVLLEGRIGEWQVFPIEYKRGKPKKDDRDLVQLCAQAIALEEMMNVKISHGFIYYNEIRQRTEFEFTNEIRIKVKEVADLMHKIIEEKVTPKAKRKSHCKMCSLIKICQPDWHISNDYVRKYIKQISFFEQEDDL